MQPKPLLQIDLPGIPKIRSGKVRELFDLGDRLLIVATDRISAFDCVMPNGIPRKGEILTQISFFWFEKFAKLIPNHLLAAADDPLPARLRPFVAMLARSRMIIDDTKFEFGLWDDKLILIDEVLTPDSSRFWPADQYQPGKSQPSFDKQFVRDYLESLDWNKTPPAPALPDSIVSKTQAKY